jgi:tRNA G18 (ribose-2'-O)-methylase SpoU
VVRTANAFLAAEVHIVGRRRWNRRGAMVTDRYQHIRHHATVTDLARWAAAADLPVLGIDNLPGSLPAGDVRAAERAACCCSGRRARAVRPGAGACRDTLSIAQYGSTRSINAGAAAVVALHAWVRAHAEPPG